MVWVSALCGSRRVEQERFGGGGCAFMGGPAAAKAEAGSLSQKAVPFLSDDSCRQARVGRLGPRARAPSRARGKRAAGRPGGGRCSGASKRPRRCGMRRDLARAQAATAAAATIAGGPLPLLPSAPLSAPPPAPAHSLTSHHTQTTHPDATRADTETESSFCSPLPPRDTPLSFSNNALQAGLVRVGQGGHALGGGGGAPSRPPLGGPRRCAGGLVVAQRESDAEQRARKSLLFSAVRPSRSKRQPRPRCLIGGPGALPTCASSSARTIDARILRPRGSCARVRGANGRGESGGGRKREGREGALCPPFTPARPLGLAPLQGSRHEIHLCWGSARVSGTSLSHLQPSLDHRSRRAGSAFSRSLLLILLPPLFPSPPPSKKPTLRPSPSPLPPPRPWPR